MKIQCREKGWYDKNDGSLLVVAMQLVFLGSLAMMFYFLKERDKIEAKKEHKQIEANR